MPDPAARSGGTNPPWSPLLLLAATLLAWSGILAGGFRFDDLPNLVHDPATFQASVFLDRLGWGLRPLLRASYFLDHALWGMRPAGFLLTQLLLHAGCVLGVHQLARQRLGHGTAAFAAGLCFALQPAHAEAVAYLSGRSVLLSTTLLVAGLLAHERAREGGRAWRLGSLAAFALACLARETALVFPLLLALWEGTRPEAGPRRVWPGPAAGLPALAVAAATLLLLVSLRTYRELFGFSWALRGPLENLGLHLAALPLQLSLWFRPWALSPVHAPPAVDGAAVLLGLCLALALAAAWFLRRRSPVAALAALWVLVALAPTHTVFSRLDPITERPLYLAWLGPALLLGQVAVAPARRGILLPAAAGVLLLAAGATIQRVRVWTDPLRLWADTVAKAPHSSLAWNNLGAARREAGDPVGAAVAVRRALQLDPANRTARLQLLELEFSEPVATLQGREP